MTETTEEVCPGVAEKRAELLQQHQIVKFSKWCKDVGISRVTAWRYRQLGWITPTIVIAGHWFLSIDDIAAFVRRAKTGEFSKQNRKPK